MDWDRLSIGSSGSLVTNLFLLAIMQNVSEPPWPFRAPPPAEPAGASVLASVWRPFIHNHGHDLGVMDHACPAPRAEGIAFRLDEAPLPAGYDPHARRDGALHACVLVHPDGRIGAVSLIGSGVPPTMRLRLRRTIAARWRFAPVRTPERAAWQRVRLDAGPVEGAVAPRNLLY